MKKCLLCLFWLLIPSSIIFAQSASAIRKGLVSIKITEQTAQQLEQMAKPLVATSGPLEVGIQSLDAVNARYHAMKMQRVFTIGGTFEERQRRFGLHLWYEIAVDDQADIMQVVKDYQGLSMVEEASPMYNIRPIQDVPFSTSIVDQHQISPMVSSNDPAFNQQWHYNNTGQTASKAVAGYDIRLPAAWDYTKGISKVIVSIVDGGIDYQHPDLAPNMWPGIGKNFIPGMPEVTAHAHGTHVAGTVAARSNNGIGVAGVAGGWANTAGALLMSCQIFDESVKTPANTADAIRFGADNGAVISQNSWGYDNAGAYEPAVRTAINYFITYAGKDNQGNPLPGTPMAGGIVIFAAGNDNSTRNDWYPSAWPEVLSVAAIGPTGRRAYYSNYNSTVDITAPGGDLQVQNPEGAVLSTLPGGQYGWKQGTSMACPHVSGIAALVLSRLGSETYTPAMLRERLLLSANPLYDEPMFEDGKMGVGLVDASRAVLDYASVTGITLPATSHVYLLRTSQLIPAFQPVTSTNQHVTWSSANDAVASVDKRGIVTGKALGATTITVTTEDGGFQASTVVSVVPVPVAEVEISPASVTLKSGQNYLLTVNIKPTDASDKTMQWQSLDPGLVSVNPSSGVIEASPNNVGSTFIVAISTDGGFKDSSFITVVRPVSGISLSPHHIRLVEGDTASLRVEIYPSDAYDKTFNWINSNNAIATVANNGKVTAKKEGLTRITVKSTDGGYTDVCEIEIFSIVQVPLGFSPNGDGINDYFELLVNSQEFYALQVFDRSGQIYYQSVDYRNDWDGTANTGNYNGKKVPAGTYFYTVTGKSGSSKTGYVVIKY